MITTYVKCFVIVCVKLGKEPADRNCSLRGVPRVRFARPIFSPYPEGTLDNCSACTGKLGWIHAKKKGRSSTALGSRLVSRSCKPRS